jgi:hypothetical protein
MISTQPGGSDVLVMVLLREETILEVQVPLMARKTTGIVTGDSDL